MAVTATPFGKFVHGLGLGYFDFTAGNDLAHLKVLLAKSAYTPNVDTHEFLSDVTNEVPAGSGYTTGGVALTGTSWTYDSSVPTNRRAILGADPASWTGLTIAAGNAARYAVVYRDTGTAATSRLLGYVNFGVDKTPVSEDFIVTFSSGVLRIRVV